MFSLKSFFLIFLVIAFLIAVKRIHYYFVPVSIDVLMEQYFGNTVVLNKADPLVIKAFTEVGSASRYRFKKAAFDPIFE